MLTNAITASTAGNATISDATDDVEERKIHDNIAHCCSSTKNSRSFNDNSTNEWVLLVPPKLTKYAFKILVQYECVARPWHLDGRYGSRTHQHRYSSAQKNDNASTCSTDEPDVLYIGLPIRSKDMVLTKAEMRSWNVHEQQEKNESINSENDNNQGIDELDETDNMIQQEVSTTTTTGKRKRSTNTGTHDNLLQKLLIDNDVHIVYKPYTPTNRRLTRPPFDATIHPERKPKTAAKLTNQSASTSLKISTNTIGSPCFTYIELFTGIGGFGVALEALGGKCVMASEIDANCRNVYVDNFPRNIDVLHHDIYDVPDAAIPTKADIVVGGFPCQPFSALGNQPGMNDPKGILFLQIIRVLRRSQPSAFLLENVPGLLQMKESYDTIVRELQNVGYSVTTEIIDARGLTASTRKRLFFVGIRTSVTPVTPAIFEFPFMPDLQLRTEDVIALENHITAGNDDGNNNSEKSNQNESSLSSSTTLDGIDINILQITDHQLQTLNESKYWKPAKMAWPNNTCSTLVSHYGHSIARGHSQLVPTYNNPRRFTPRECARIMGFPNSYVLRSYNHDEYLQQRKERRQVNQGSNTTDDNTDIMMNNRDIDNQNDIRENDGSNKNDNSSDAESCATISLWGPRIHLKQQYRMFGNAVCPPVIAALAGAVLALCPTIPGYDQHGDWVEWGRQTALQLAYQATLKDQK